MGGDNLAAAADQLRDQGFAVLPDVIDRDVAAQVLQRLWRAADENRKAGHDTYMPVLDPNPSNVRVFYLLERDAVFRELIEHPAAVALVEALLGPNFLISNFTANIARPGSKSMALHSDLSLVMPEPWHAPLSLNIIWCLSDVRGENGATLYIPGSHLWRTRTDAPEDAHERLRPFEAKAGSIIAMDGRMWHTSGANVTRDEDRALLFGYYTRGCCQSNANMSPADGLSPNPARRYPMTFRHSANAAERRTL
jgi:ectoine hydroxylase-related dioxygenase (phytanoyl-CoA dioxygenase family)